MSSLVCECCESTDTVVTIKPYDITIQGKSFLIEQYETAHCNKCGYSFEPMDMHDRNLDKLRKILNESV